jgi:hypothetical protein
VAERGGGACAFLAVIGSVAVLPGTHRYAVEIRPVAVERLRGGERRSGFRRKVTGIARS